MIFSVPEKVKYQYLVTRTQSRSFFSRRIIFSFFSFFFQWVTQSSWTAELWYQTKIHYYYCSCYYYYNFLFIFIIISHQGWLSWIPANLGPVNWIFLAGISQDALYDSSVFTKLRLISVEEHVQSHYFSVPCLSKLKSAHKERVSYTLFTILTISNVIYSSINRDSTPSHLDNPTKLRPGPIFL